MKNRKLTEKRLLFIKKILFVLTILLLIYHVGWMIFILAYRHHIGDAYIKYVTTMIFRILQFSAMLLVLAAPKFLKKWFKINVPLALYIVIALFAFNALVLGDGLDFYGKYPWWDSFLHFHSGIILSFVALWFIHIMMAEKSKFIYMNKYFTCLFLVVFSLGIGAFWEILEYSCDGIFHTNAQQYMASTKGTLVSKNDIPLKGHEALKDTMKDLMLDLGGSLIVATYGFVRHDEIVKKISRDHLSPDDILS